MTAHHQPRYSQGEAEWLCKATNRVLDPTATTPRALHIPRHDHDSSRSLDRCARAA